MTINGAAQDTYSQSACYKPQPEKLEPEKISNIAL